MQIKKILLLCISFIALATATYTMHGWWRGRGGWYGGVGFGWGGGWGWRRPYYGYGWGGGPYWGGYWGGPYYRRYYYDEPVIIERPRRSVTRVTYTTQEPTYRNQPSAQPTKSGQQPHKPEVREAVAKPAAHRSNEGG